MTCKIPALIFLFLTTFCSICLCRPNTLQLRNDRLGLSFSPENGFALVEMVDVINSTRIVDNPDGKPLWKIVWTDKENSQLRLAADAPCSLDSRYERQGNTLKLTLEWKHMALGSGSANVKASVSLDTDSELSEWHLTIDWTDSTVSPVRVDFPNIEGISKITGRDYLAIPYYWGRLVRDPMKRLKNFKINYPSPASMQFLAYYGDNHGIFLSTYDPEIWMKSWVWKAEEHHDRGNLRIINYPPLENGYRYEIPYPIRVGVFEGDWYDAARLYRRWATGQKWCSSGKVSERTDIPQWFKATAVWLKYYGEPGKVLEELLDHISYLKAPVSLLYYRYPISPFDDNYPEFLPAKKGFLESIQGIHKLGSFVIPYTNGAIWDMDTHSWEMDNGERGSVTTPDGTSFKVNFRDNTFAYMCPSSQDWQDKVLNFTKKLILDYNTDGVYLDFMVAAFAKFCWSPLHGHPLNGGRYWGEGTRILMNRLREAIRPVKPGAVFTTEEINEAYIDRYDAFLTLDITRGANVPPFSFIPLFSAVYHDYAIQFGSDAKLSAIPDHFSGLIAYHFILGSKLTISEFNPPKIAEARENAEYLNELAECYSKVGKKFLLYGEWLRPPNIQVDSLKIPMRGKKVVDVPLPTVLHSLWRAPDGSLGFVITNWTNEEKDVRFSLNLEAFGLDDGPWYLHTLWPMDRKAVSDLGNRTWKFHDKLYPRSIRLFEITRRRSPSVETETGAEADLPFFIAHRGKDGKYRIPPAGKDFRWLANGKRLTVDDKSEVFLEGLPTSQDFLLLEKVSSKSPHVDRPLAGIEPGPISKTYDLRDLSLLSRNISKSYRHLNDEQASLTQITSVESLRMEVTEVIYRQTGLKLSIIPPSHYRLIPGVPFRISCQLSNPEKAPAILKSLNLYPVLPQSVVKHVDINHKTNEYSTSSYIREVETHQFEITMTDISTAEHAITFYAEAEVYWQNDSLTLGDQITIPCDLPLMTEIDSDVERHYIAGSSFPVSLTIENISDYPLNVSIKAILPEGWLSRPVEIKDILIPPGRSTHPRRKPEFIVIPPDDASHGLFSLSFVTIYNDLQRFLVEDKWIGAVTPRLDPIKDGSWPSDISPGEKVLIRKKGRILLYMTKGETAEIQITSRKVSSYSEPVRYAIYSPSGSKIKSDSVPVGRSSTEKIIANTEGTYILDVEPALGSCTVETAKQHMIFEASSTQPLHIFKTRATWFFYVPHGAREFTLGVTCGGENETVDIYLFDPGGNEIFRREDVVLINGEFSFKVPREFEGRIWRMVVDPREDVSLELHGDVIPYMTDQPMRLLKQKVDK